MAEKKAPSKKVKVVLVPPIRRGKIDPRVIEAAVKKVRDDRRKALARG